MCECWKEETWLYKYKYTSVRLHKLCLNHFHPPFPSSLPQSPPYISQGQYFDPGPPLLLFRDPRRPRVRRRHKTTPNLDIRRKKKVVLSHGNIFMSAVCLNVFPGPIFLLFKYKTTRLSFRMI